MDNNESIISKSLRADFEHSIEHIPPLYHRTLLESLPHEYVRSWINSIVCFEQGKSIRYHKQTPLVIKVSTPYCFNKVKLEK